MKKNVGSQVIGCQLDAKADGTPITSGTTTVYVTGDGGSQATGTVGSGAASHKGQGFWEYSPSQAETNYDHVAYTFVNSNGINQTVQVYPTSPQTGDNYARLGAPAGASLAADIAAIKALLPSSLVGGKMDASVGAVAAGAITSSGFAAGAINATAIASAAITNAKFAAGAIDAAAIADNAFDLATFATDTNPLFALLARGTAGTATSGQSTIVLTGLSFGADTNPVGSTIVLQASGQSRVVTGWTNGTSTATVDKPWTTTATTPAYYLFAGPPAPAAAPDVNVASISAGAITASSIATDAITAGQIATDAGTEIAAAMLNATASSYNTAGTIGQKINSAGTAGDPLTAVVPGAYAAGTAGYLIGTNLDAKVSTAGGGGLTAGGIADAVWDEIRADHVIPGSFGQGSASVQGNVTGSVGSVTGAVGSVTGAVGSVTGAVGSVTGNVGGNVVGSVGSVVGSVGSVVGTINADMKKINGYTIIGNGTTVKFSVS